MPKSNKLQEARGRLFDMTIFDYLERSMFIIKIINENLIVLILAIDFL